MGFYVKLFEKSNLLGGLEYHYLIKKMRVFLAFSAINRTSTKVF